MRTSGSLEGQGIGQHCLLNCAQTVPIDSNRVRAEPRQYATFPAERTFSPHPKQSGNCRWPVQLCAVQIDRLSCVLQRFCIVHARCLSLTRSGCSPSLHPSGRSIVQRNLQVVLSQGNQRNADQASSGHKLSPVAGMPRHMRQWRRRPRPTADRSELFFSLCEKSCGTDRNKNVGRPL
jgi:hypothetical protein